MDYFNDVRTTLDDMRVINERAINDRIFISGGTNPLTN